MRKFSKSSLEFSAVFWNLHLGWIAPLALFLKGQIFSFWKNLLNHRKETMDFDSLSQSLFQQVILIHQEFYSILSNPMHDKFYFPIQKTHLQISYYSIFVNKSFHQRSKLRKIKKKERESDPSCYELSITIIVCYNRFRGRSDLEGLSELGASLHCGGLDRTAYALGTCCDWLKRTACQLELGAV